jgi:hypothetical protein
MKNILFALILASSTMAAAEVHTDAETLNLYRKAINGELSRLAIAYHNCHDKNNWQWLDLAQSVEVSEGYSPLLEFTHGTKEEGRVVKYVINATPDYTMVTAIFLEFWENKEVSVGTLKDPKYEIQFIRTLNVRCY